MPYAFSVELAGFRGASTVPLDAVRLKGWLEQGARDNEMLLAAFPEIPDPLAAGLRYDERAYTRDLPMRDALTIWRGNRVTECKGVCMWRVASLRRQGVAAKIRLAFLDQGTIRIWHVLTGMPDGRIEDTSQLIGMR